MKLYIALIVCSAVLYAQCDEVHDKAVAMANECKDESGASDADVDAMLKHEPAGSHEAKCLRACLLKKYGIFDADGHFVKDIALEVTKLMARGDAEKEVLATEVVEECGSIELEEDDCEAAEQIGSCFKEHAAEKGLKLEE